MSDKTTKPGAGSDLTAAEALEKKVAARTSELSLALAEVAQAKHEVEDQRQQFQQILESMPLGVLVLGRDGSNVFTNERVLSFSSRPLPESYDLGELRFDYDMKVAGSDVPYPVDRMPGFRALAGEECYVDDIEMDGVEGRIRLGVRGRPMRDAEGEVVAAIVTIEDITEQMRRAEDLANERERLAVTLRAISDGVIGIDGAGRVTMMNPAAETITGWSARLANGRDVLEVFPLRREGATGDRASSIPLAEVLAGQTPLGVVGEGVLRNTRGDELLVSYSLAPVRDSASSVRGAALCLRDVTAQRAAEREQLRASKLDSVGILAGGIAHDFNNILTSLLAAASLAEEEAGDAEPLREYLQEIREATLRARDLTQQLLTFSRGGAPVKQTAAIADLIRESVVFALHGSRVRVTFDLPERLRPVELDRGQISQVLNNLVINAVQAMPDGGLLRVVARNERPVALEGALAVCVSIIDEGPGIAPEHLSKVFDPYFTTKPGGSGLGLATSYSIVRNHGGVLTVESVPGEGTCVSMFLPASDAAVATATGEVALVSGAGRALVVDDEEAIRRVTTRMLKRLGYEPAGAATGDEALELLREGERTGRPFAVVVMDLTIPGGKGGVETVAELRSEGMSMPVLASSGYSTDPVMASFHDYGFDGVLKKPYTMKELSAALAQLPTLRPGAPGAGAKKGPLTS